MTATATARPQLRTGYPLTWVAAVLVLVTPLTITLLLVHGLLRASVTDFVPATDDEMLYWHQISTFARAGFNGGYYTYEEQPAPWALSHFDAHGPFFTALYGSLGRLFGWQRFTPVVFNLVIITMALAGLMRLARPSGVQLAYLGLVVGTCWPLWWWVFSSMQEPLHLGAALVLAGVT